MIDTSTHKMVPFSEASRHIPGNPHVATLARWRLHGVKGRKLETILIGGRRWTSLEAIQAFLNSGADQPPVESVTDRERRARQAGAALQAIGS